MSASFERAYRDHWIALRIKEGGYPPPPWPKRGMTSNLVINSDRAYNIMAVFNDERKNVTPELIEGLHMKPKDFDYVLRALARAEMLTIDRIDNPKGGRKIRVVELTDAGLDALDEWKKELLI